MLPARLTYSVPDWWYSDNFPWSSLWKLSFPAVLPDIVPAVFAQYAVRSPLSSIPQTHYFSTAAVWSCWLLLWDVRWSVPLQLPGLFPSGQCRCDHKNAHLRLPQMHAADPPESHPMSHRLDWNRFQQAARSHFRLHPELWTYIRKVSHQSH